MARAQSTASTSAKPVVDVAAPLMAELDAQSQQNTCRHSRTASRGGHGRGHSRAGSISITGQALASQVAASAAVSTSSRPFSTHNASASHLRSHSRSGSRSLATRSRPNSLLLGGRKDDAVLLAVEHPAGVDPLGDWRDVSGSPLQSSGTAADRSQQIADASSLFTRPTPAADPESAAGPASTASTSKQERRQSRHARRTSVATKRESMEIMGGIGLGVAVSPSYDSLASSRRRSSRMSGLPSASVLFGVPDASDGSKPSQPNWDWKTAFANAEAEEPENEEGRLTALEKLEGRVQPAAIPAGGQSGSQSWQSRRISGHQRQSSVQLPSFDDMHGSDGMDRRASIQLLESNEKTTSEASSPGAREGRRGSLTAPATNSLPPRSPTSPLTLITSKRPGSMIVHPEAIQPEGLGTLMEEEEEEESLSPVRERRSFDTPLSGSSSLDDELRRQRRAAEEETIKKNRRASLTPRPLKLKSRPPSLYLAPSFGAMSASHSLPTLSHSNPNSSGIASPYSNDTDKTPRLESDALLPSEPLTPKVVDDAPARDSPTLVKSWSFANAQQKLASQAATDVTPESSTDSAVQREVTRAYRTSMVFSPPTTNVPTAGPPAPRERQGMRTLRLGSHQSSLASLSSVAESNVSSSDSIGQSIASNRRRNSIIRADSGSVTLTQEELGNGLPSSATPRNARRSSIHYKPSGQHSASDSVGGHFATPSLASLGGVPMAVHDELKAKASRDAALLESTKDQLERLQRELVLETERSAREFAELKQSSGQEQTALRSRVDELETAVAEATQKVAELERELCATRETIEDLEAERDVLRDDVEGWRSRCQDTEKSLRSERSKLDDQRKLKNAAKLRIHQLTQALEKEGIAIPADEVNVVQALDEIQLDVVSVLRSPALGSASPVLGGGYFSPAAADPPPMTIKLLADMRQQIFNLAGSLEHERSEHLKAKDELARLREEQLQRSQSWTSASFATSDTADEIRESHRDLPASGGPTPERRRTSSGASVVGKNKRHVFAYDSSMGSFGQSTTSLGSASMSMTTEEPATDDERSHGSPSTKQPFLEADEAATGLGMGSLQTLDEIEEVSESGVEDSSTAGVSTDSTDEDRQPVEMETDRTWADIEAGIVDDRPSLDVSESSFGDRQYEDAASPMPLHSEKFSSPMHSPAPPSSSATFVPHPGNPNHGFRSTGSSLESNDGPATPPLDHHHNRFLGDDASTASSRCPSPRPEFIPDWNFEMAIRRGRLSRSDKKDAAIEDFFGIMHEGSLPPLTTSQEPIDMPPIRLNARGEAAIVPRSTGTRVASTVGRRPPVARSAYARESFSESSGSPYGSFQARGGDHESFSAASSAAAFGSRALSRMSLQGLTSAFSGLSGYLTNQSGAAVTAAAAATKMCGPGEMAEADSVHASLSWTAQRRAFEDGNAEAEAEAAAFYGPRSANSLFARDMVPSPDAFSTSSKARKTASRAFVDAATIPPPMATPVWQLDFSRSSMGGPVFSL
ncbi:uncharacterized protein PSFLO_03913 [Pseudozyma flocculosa]|nr:uncharacterized protein PSFLO_03913 [Pseudozyma flocculosa]